jgi:hypothetical protein
VTINALVFRSFEPEDRKTPWMPVAEIYGSWVVLSEGCSTRKAALAWLDRWAAQRGIELSIG